MATKTVKNNVTTLEDLKHYAEEGVTVEITPFSQSVPFICKLKRPSMLDLISEGVFSNRLLSSAMQLFLGDEKEEQKKQTNEQIIEDAQQTKEVMTLIAKHSLISPTLEEIESVGLTLSMQQLLDIYSYVNTGIEELIPFRKE